MTKLPFSLLAAALCAQCACGANDFFDLPATIVVPAAIPIASPLETAPVPASAAPAAPKPTVLPPLVVRSGTSLDRAATPKVMMRDGGTNDRKDWRREEKRREEYRRKKWD